jgi:hypothetical protein
MAGPLINDVKTQASGSTCLRAEWRLMPPPPEIASIHAGTTRQEIHRCAKGAGDIVWLIPVDGNEGVSAMAIRSRSGKHHF